MDETEEKKLIADLRAAMRDDVREVVHELEEDKRRLLNRLDLAFLPLTAIIVAMLFMSHCAFAEVGMLAQPAGMGCARVFTKKVV